MRISDWSSDVCSSDLFAGIGVGLDVVRPVRPVPAELAAAQQCAATRGHGLYRDLPTTSRRGVSALSTPNHQRQPPLPPIPRPQATDTTPKSPRPRPASARGP